MQVGHELFVFGGSDVTLEPHAVLYVFDTHALTWASPGAAGSYPAARSYHSMTVVDEDIFVYGGSDTQSQPLGDLHVLDAAAMEFRQPTQLGSVPSARKGHTLTKSGTYLYLFGGMGEGEALLNDAHRLDPSSVTWRALQTTGDLPPGRDGHTATAMEDRLFVFGGADSNGKLNDVRVLDLHALRWSRPRSVGGPPEPRWGHSATLISQQVYMFGGVDDAQQVLSDIWVMGRHCTGQLTLTASRDSFSSGDGLYQANANCSWHLAGTSEPNRQVQLFFSSFDLEQGRDWVRVYDGASAGEPLHSLTGTSLPGAVLSTAGSLLVTFSSDGVVGGEGFEASYFEVCAAGYVPDPYNPDECLPCAAGTHAATPGLLACTACPAYTYSATAGAAACTDCPSFSRAAAAGASAASDCFCLAGYFRNSTGCSLCPAGAECVGGGQAIRSIPDWCRVGSDFYKCCNEGDCPGGDAECPSAASRAPLGETTCGETAILGLAVLTFIIAMALLCVVALCCWCVGFTKGMRKGTRDALREIVAPFQMGDADKDDDAFARVEAFAAQPDVPADDVAILDVAELVEAEPEQRTPPPRPSAGFQQQQQQPSAAAEYTASMQASPVGSAGGFSRSSGASGANRGSRRIVE